MGRLSARPRNQDISSEKKKCPFFVPKIRCRQEEHNCRAVYDAGFSPVCPALFLPLFLRDEIPQEHKDGIDMAREYLRRARVLVVCGSTVDENVKNDIAVAERLRITATTLDGILTVKGQGRRNE